MTKNTTPKTVVITGASSGIGAAAARQLHADGHEVVVIGRSPEMTQAIAAELNAESHVADFTRLDDVRRLAAALGARHPRIDVLANNTGGIFGDRAKTVDRFEKTFQINYLAPFLLTQQLTNTLVTSRASVIQTSSTGARMSGRLVIDDLEHDKDFSPTRAYGTAKLADILSTRELHTRFHDLGVSAAAFHPGNVATGFATESDSFLRHITTNPLARALMSSPDKAAGQLVWLAETTPGTDWESGVYYEKRKPARRTSKQADDKELARQLWDRSEALLARTKPARHA